MSKAERDLQRKNLRAAERRHEERCRDVISQVRGLAGPLTYAAIREQLLPPRPSRKSSTDEDIRRYVQAEAELVPILQACMARGWLLPKGAKAIPGIFYVDDERELEVTIGGKTVKSRMPKKKSPTSTAITLLATAQASEAVRIRAGDKETILTGEQARLFEVIRLKSEAGEVTVPQDVHLDDRGSFARAVNRLREELARKLDIDPEVMRRGIRTVRSCGYDLDGDFLKVRWTSGSRRQRGHARGSKVT